MIISDMDMIAQDMVCIAERADGKGKVEGYYFCLHHNDGRTHLHHFIIPLEADLSKGTPLDKIQVEIEPESITLKAQEPIEARLHLCESCKKQFPECDTTKDGVMFGSGTGNDNIIGCTAYVNRWKAQVPRVMTLEEVLEWAETPAEKRDPIFFEQKEGKGPNGWICNSVCPKDYYLCCLDKDARCWTSRPTDEQRKATPWE